MWAGGPPKPMQPIRAHSVAMVRRGTGAGTLRIRADVGDYSRRRSRTPEGGAGVRDRRKPRGEGSLGGRTSLPYEVVCKLPSPGFGGATAALQLREHSSVVW